MGCIQGEDTEPFISPLDPSHPEATWSICKIRMRTNPTLLHPNSPTHIPKGLTNCLIGWHFKGFKSLYGVDTLLWGGGVG